MGAWIESGEEAFPFYGYNWLETEKNLSLFVKTSVWTRTTGILLYIPLELTVFMLFFFCLSVLDVKVQIAQLFVKICEISASNPGRRVVFLVSQTMSIKCSTSPLLLQILRFRK